jgi:hypothetical protein
MRRKSVPCIRVVQVWTNDDQRYAQEGVRLGQQSPKRAKVKHAPSDLSEQLQDFVIDEVIG